MSTTNDMNSTKINTDGKTGTGTGTGTDGIGAPDAMNQTIYQMMTSESNDHHQLSRQISSLRPKLPQHHQQQHTSYIKNTGIPSSSTTTLSLQQQYLPYPLPWRANAGPSPDQLPPSFLFLTESCAGKAAIGVFGGAACGLLMGVFLGAMGDMTSPVTVLNGKEVPQAPFKEQMRQALRATGEKSLYWSRNFAFITGVFGGSDCLVEKYRGTHDVWNAVLSGCVTGAAMQAKSGPQASAIGCGGFAAFSLIIDKVMGH